MASTPDIAQLQQRSGGRSKNEAIICLSVSGAIRYKGVTHSDAHGYLSIRILWVGTLRIRYPQFLKYYPDILGKYPDNLPWQDPNHGNHETPSVKHWIGDVGAKRPNMLLPAL